MKKQVRLFLHEKRKESELVSCQKKTSDKFRTKKGTQWLITIRMDVQIMTKHIPTIKYYYLSKEKEGSNIFILLQDLLNNRAQMIFDIDWD